MGTLFNANLKSKKLEELYEELVLQYKDEYSHPSVKKYFLDQIKYEIEEEKERLLKERSKTCYEHIFFAPEIDDKYGLTNFTCVKCGKTISLCEQNLWIKNFKGSISKDFYNAFDGENGELILNNAEEPLSIEYYRKLYLEVIKKYNNYAFVIRDMMLESYEEDKKSGATLAYKKRNLK